MVMTNNVFIIVVGGGDFFSGIPCSDSALIHPLHSRTACWTREDRGQQRSGHQHLAGPSSPGVRDPRARRGVGSH